MCCIDCMSLKIPTTPDAFKHIFYIRLLYNTSSPVGYCMRTCSIVLNLLIIIIAIFYLRKTCFCITAFSRQLLFGVDSTLYNRDAILIFLKGHLEVGRAISWIIGLVTRLVLQRRVTHWSCTLESELGHKLVWCRARACQAQMIEYFTRVFVVIAGLLKKHSISVKSIYQCRFVW